MRLRKRWLWLVALGLVQSCHLLDDNEPLAQVTRAEGPIQLADDEGSQSVTAQTGADLFEGNVLSTGPKAEADVSFLGGTTITLEENASLVIRRSGGTETSIGAILLGGSARGTSSASGLVVTIGTPFGIATLGGSQAEFSINAETGFDVTVGQIVVELANGQKAQIEAGNRLTVGGLVVPLGTETVDPTPAPGIELDPITVVLLGDPKQVQVKGAEDEKWRAPKKRESLQAGDTIRTRKAKNTQLRLSDEAGVKLSSGSELQLGDSSKKDGEHRAAYKLKPGSQATVELDKKGARHTVELASGDKINVSADTARARVDIAAQDDGKARVTVRLGSAKLDDGSIIEAGNTALVENGKILGEARRLAGDSVSVTPKGSALIYYRGSPPAIAFRWNTEGDEEAEPYPIEISRSKDFKQPLISEQVSKPHFVFGQFGAGRYYWRVKKKTGWTQGTFKILKDVDRGCKNCKRVNKIFDTGEKTVIYYQRALPAISLRWKAKPEAQQYRVKVYADRNFDSPILNTVVEATTLPLGSGRLKEGKYIWLISGLNNDGKEISTGSVNTLEIAFDNAVTELQVLSPAHGAKIRGSRTTTHGELQLGARLTINGRSVKADKQGRFKHSVSLSKGFNRLVYRLIARDGIERFYTRDVYRR